MRLKGRTTIITFYVYYFTTLSLSNWRAINISTICAAVPNFRYARFWQRAEESSKRFNVISSQSI